MPGGRDRVRLPRVRCPTRGAEAGAAWTARRAGSLPRSIPAGVLGLAMDKALLSECVHCGFCLPTCPT